MFTTDYRVNELECWRIDIILTTNKRVYGLEYWKLDIMSTTNKRNYELEYWKISLMLTTKKKVYELEYWSISLMYGHIHFGNSNLSGESSAQCSRASESGSLVLAIDFFGKTRSGGAVIVLKNQPSLFHIISSIFISYGYNRPSHVVSLTTLNQLCEAFLPNC